jgi:hypothetical protein
MRASKITRLSALVVLATTSQAAALPSMTANYGQAKQVIQAFAKKDARLEGANIYLEADTASKTVYLTPASRKQQSGVLQSMGEPRCANIDQMYSLTYNVPAVPPAQWAKFARENGPFSPFFDLMYGDAIRNGSLLQQIATRIGSAQAIREQHAAEYQAYLATKGTYDDAVQTRGRIQAEMDAFDARIDGLLKRLDLATEPDSIAELRAEIAEAKEDRKKNLPPLKREYAKADVAVDDAFKPYNTAKAAWDRFAVDLATLDHEVESLSKIVATMRKSYQDSFQLSRETLEAFEGSLVGYASAAYTIYGSEVTAGREALAGVGDTSWIVSPVPLFNVTLAPERWSSPAILSPSPGTKAVGARVEGTVPGPATDGAVNVGTGTEPAKPTFQDVYGNPLASVAGNPVQDRKVLPNEAAGSYRAAVTRAAYCAGSSTTPNESFTVPLDIGTPNSSNEVTVSRPKLTQRTTNVLAQSVALSYSYYVDAEPINVRCDMNVSKFLDFAQNQGDIHILFWGNKWDDVTRKQTADSGISCKSKISPTADGQEAEQKAFIQEQEDRAMREMAAEFIGLFAKTWEVSSNDRSSLLAAERKPGAAMADALGDCKKKILFFEVDDPACSYSKAVFKASDEVFGFREGSHKLKDSMQAHVYRDYSYDEYRRVSGVAAIDLTVPVQ